ncbi:hypothetical protein FQN49_005666, partial [Arthroderma sp. PD_2]
VALQTLSESELPAGTKYSITASGWWQAIWDEDKKTVVSTYLQDLSGGFSGDFTSNTVRVTMA